MTVELHPSALSGCYELRTRIAEDLRGRFVKVFHAPAFAEHGLETSFPEEYYSISGPGVIRGMHFQTPPHDYVKLVYVVGGAVLDVVLDLRKGSPTYGQTQLFELDAYKANMVYVPKGMAHGFYVRTAPAIMVYRVSAVYAPEHDKGVRWDSIGPTWPATTPVVSERDRNLPALHEFQSPFSYA